MRLPFVKYCINCAFSPPIDCLWKMNVCTHCCRLYFYWNKECPMVRDYILYTELYFSIVTFYSVVASMLPIINTKEHECQSL